MTDKSLKSIAIDIKGKEYVLVKDRISFFNESYTGGAIKTKLISQPNAELVVIKAKVIPDLSKPDRFFTGYSQARWGEGMVNTTAALENAETSAVGRALAMMGIGIIDSVSSADEMNKALSEPNPADKKYGSATKTIYASEAQRNLIIDLGKKAGYTTKDLREKITKKYGVDAFEDLNKAQASGIIKNLIDINKKEEIDLDEIDKAMVGGEVH